MLQRFPITHLHRQLTRRPIRLEADEFDVVGEQLRPTGINQSHQRARENVPTQLVRAVLTTERRNRRRITPAVPQHRNELKQRLNVVRGRVRGGEDFDRGMVRTHIIAPAVMLNQLERQETVVEEAVQNVAGHSSEADDDHDRVDDVLEKRVYKVV